VMDGGMAEVGANDSGGGSAPPGKGWYMTLLCPPINLAEPTLLRPADWRLLTI
jgi:hypothetical protein